MKPMGLLRAAARPRNIALGLAISSPALYWLAFAKDENGQPKQARYWQVKVYGFMPLRFVSRLWGGFNSLPLPVWFRPYGYRFYSWLFGVNLDEIADADLTHYKNLGEFFYRELKPDARPISDAMLVSPSDGKVLQCGQLLDNSQIGNIKGFTYPLQRLIGKAHDLPDNGSDRDSASDSDSGSDSDSAREHSHDAAVGQPPELKNVLESVNSMDGVIPLEKTEKIGDATDNPRTLLDRPLWMPSSRDNNRLYFCVIYLAPGDYHRFHSPAAWIVQLRRHFSGELFSVAPYFQTRMPELFCLNERVALLGRWKYGFFSMTPVGATNVGSIIVNFDKGLKTNRGKLRPNTCEEASYQASSPLLDGYPLNKGVEMGGFRLGSTVVLVFEAPENFEFAVQQNSVVKMGDALGSLV